MMNKLFLFSIQYFAILFPLGLFAQKANQPLIETLNNTEGIIALWKFDEETGMARKSMIEEEFLLKEALGPIQRISEGPLSGYSILMDGSNYLSLPNADTRSLNIYGAGKEVTVIAWVKWSGEQVGFVGGMWNEYADGGKRQYGLFVNLPHYNGANQVCGHISKNGGPTPPFPYSIDYSASKQLVPKNEWTCIAFTYDGEYIKSYVNGEFKSRKPELIQHTEGFEGYPNGLTQRKNPYYYPDGMGNNGSDFTVGAVLLKNGMGNFFKGQLGGLAVFDKALSEKELKQLVK